MEICWHLYHFNIDVSQVNGHNASISNQLGITHALVNQHNIISKMIIQSVTKDRLITFLFHFKLINFISSGTKDIKTKDIIVTIIIITRRLHNLKFIQNILTYNQNDKNRIIANQITHHKTIKNRFIHFFNLLNLGWTFSKFSSILRNS